MKTEALGAKAADPPVMAASPALVCQELLSVGVGVVVKVAAVAKVDHLRLAWSFALAAWTEVPIDVARSTQVSAPHMRQGRQPPGQILGCGAQVVWTKHVIANDAHPQRNGPNEGAQRCELPLVLLVAEIGRAHV